MEGAIWSLLGPRSVDLAYSHRAKCTRQASDCNFMYYRQSNHPCTWRKLKTEFPQTYVQYSLFYLADSAADCAAVELLKLPNSPHLSHKEFMTLSITYLH